MSKIITKDSMYLIIEKNPNMFETKEEIIEYDESIKKLINDFLKSIEPVKTKEEIKQEYFDLLREKIETKYPNFFKDKSYATKINQAFSELKKYSLSKIGTLPYHIIKNTLIDYYTAFALELTYSKYENDKSIKAYSHRRIGFKSFDYSLNNEFTVKIHTNFGFGTASYFYMILDYNGIPIIPYSKIIFYNFADAKSLLFNTRDYSVNESEWRSCYDFTTNIVNEFYNSSKESFVKKYIIKSLDEFIHLLEKIKEINSFLIINDNYKLNEYLSMPNKHIIYDCENLLSNSNNSINMNKLDKLVVFCKHIDINTMSSEEQEKFSELSKLVIPIKIYDEIDKLRYAFAIDTYLENNSNIVLDNKIKIIESIIPEYYHRFKTLRGYELQRFRSNKVYAALLKLDNIEKINSTFNTTIYIQSIKDVSKTVLEQNKRFLSNLENPLNTAQKNYITVSNNLKSKVKMFKESKHYKNNIFYTAFLSFLDLLLDDKSKNENSVTYEELNEHYINLIEFYNNSLIQLKDMKIKRKYIQDLNKNNIKKLFGLEVKESNNTNYIKELKKLLDYWNNIVNQLLYIRNSIKNYDNETIFSNAKKYLNAIQSKKNIKIRKNNNVVNNASYKLVLKCFVSQSTKYKETKDEFSSINDEIGKLAKKVQEKKDIYYDLVEQNKKISNLNRNILLELERHQ